MSCSVVPSSEVASSTDVVSSGDVIALRFPYSDPPKKKISLCICLTSGLFFIISSKEYKFAPANSQVKIFKDELPCLQYDSFLDLSKAYEIDPKTIAAGAKNGIYPLDGSAKARIKYMVEQQRYLPENQRQLVLSNL